MFCCRISQGRSNALSSLEPESAGNTERSRQNNPPRSQTTKPAPLSKMTAGHDHSLLLDTEGLGAEVAGALVAAQLAILPSGETATVPDTQQHQPSSSSSFQALNDGIMDALAAVRAGGKGAGVGVTLDPSAWPIVHGSPGSEDRTAWRQPRGDPSQRFYLFSSQSVQEAEEANALYMGNLLMQNVGGPPSSSMQGSDNKDKSKGQGWSDEAEALIDFKVNDANAVSVITERASDTETRLWTSTIGNVLVYRQVKGASGLQRLASFNHGRNTRFHGSYAFVASNGTENGFFTTMNANVARFVLRGSDQEGWRVLKTGEQALPSTASTPHNDHLVGLTALADGTVVAGSGRGVLMAVRLDDQGGFLLQDAFAVQEHTPSGLPARVSNSLSSQGQAVFVVTHRELLRVDLDPTTRRFTLKWAQQYHDRDMPWYIGRLGAGSGSTPSVTECGERSLVVITDGALPMSLMWYDAATGAVVGRRAVQFGAEEGGNAPTTSEQSVAVAGCKAFVVQNYMGIDSLDPSITCASAPRLYSPLRRRLGSYCQSRLDPQNPTDLFPVRACPVVLGCSAFGAAVYELQPPGAETAAEWPVTRAWAREDVSCGTSIPLISTHPESSIVYCSGLKQGSNQWALLGMDLATGQDRAHLQYYERNLALNALANPFYAGVEATGDDMVTIGAVGGVLHLSPEYPIGGDGGGGGQGGSPLGKNAKAAGGASAAGGGGGGKKKEWFGISFLSDDASRAQAQPEGEGEGQEEPVGNGFRLIEDRTALASSSSLASASWWRGVVEGKGKAVGEAAGQGAMGAVLVLLGGGIVLMLMRWRRRGPWSPRMPR